MRLYDKANKQEWVEQIHGTPPAHVVALPDENIFWTQLPDGAQLTYDMDDIPNGTEPIPIPPEVVIRDAAHAAGITRWGLTKAQLLGDTTAVMAAVATVASDTGTTVEGVLDAI